ncbi:GNAT family N-acetyltransferase [Streptomyces sp. NPDC052396]|uniref:GNAT family N-acetyltransferase n=1 Tax=Streptomyces sp. NPDC052396 TaxID=3365689 RepID=UPI0037CFD8F1
MIALSPRTAPAAGPWAAWFPTGRPGLGSLTEHLRTTGCGRWWADRPTAARAGAVECAGHVLLGGDPQAVDPAGLAPLAHRYFAAPDRFLPVLGAAFERITPWERMIWTHPGAPAPARRPGRGMTIRRLTAADAAAVAALGPDFRRLGGSWGGAAAPAGSGSAHGAFRRGRLLSLAVTHFLGERYADIAVATVPAHRGHGLALACVTELCMDLNTMGRAVSWTCSRDNHPSRRLAAAAGFQPALRYVHHAAGAPRIRPAAPAPAHGYATRCP